ncbi:hypothetical protein D9757_000545 [Collybiopsis confluens]|uniref:rRNA adenine N(6)-methyltransferase n=1 Tax=Collybiopsis confluens TaxID=2823264 RepID=A0A8H5I1H4_9AGAR|nr:hypothetical protein D9757_000545 [Collybiopsis confluens]
MSFRSISRLAQLGVRSRLVSTSAGTTRKKGKTPKTFDEVVAKPRSKPKKAGSRLTFHPDTPQDKTNLPPREDWREIFSWVPVNDRVSISNAETAALVAESFVPEGSKDQVVIEAFPGPGQLTRALMNLPKSRIKKIIVVENEVKYVEYLRPLAALDPRVTVINSSAATWDTFDIIEAEGHLKDTTVMGWNEGVHPNLQFISHLPLTVLGEQLISQFLRLIPERSWLFKYGRIRMNLILSEYRLTAGPNDKAMRCKLSIMARATANSQLLLYDQLQPYPDHFHPILKGAASAVKNSSNRKIGIPFQAVEIIPLEEQVIDGDKLDIWDYCVRRLFVRKATTLEKCIEDLGPGASSLLPKLDGVVDSSKRVRELSVAEWAALTKEFDAWPFAPKDLRIHDAMLDNYGGRGTLTRF